MHHSSDAAPYDGGKVGAVCLVFQPRDADLWTQNMSRQENEIQEGRSNLALFLDTEKCSMHLAAF